MMPYEFCAIDKDGFKDWIKKNITPESFQVALCAMVDSVESVTAKVSTRGKWIETEELDGGSYYTCSACGEDWVCIESTPEENNMLYCPLCGAKMDLEDE